MVRFDPILLMNASRLRPLVVPALLLAICVLAFGLQTPWLGFYLDDWIILAADHSGGAHRLMEYAWLGNRPLVFWMWWLGFRILGEAPLGWQLWALLWRWLTVLAAWKTLEILWLGQPRRNLVAALLFAVYPLFMQQPSALTFSFHWICFFLYFLSLIAMLLAVRRPDHYLGWSALAILVNAAQLFSQEFFVGLELLRPLILFIALDSAAPLAQKIRRGLLHWLPYVGLLAGFLLWRLRFMPTPGQDRNTPVTLLNLLHAPLQTLPGLITRMIQDIVQGMAGVWGRTLEPSAFSLQPLSNGLAWLIALAALFIAWIALQRVSSLQESPAGRWRREALVVGGTALLAGFAPGWSIGRFITDTATLYNDRFGLAAMFGGGLLLSVFIDWLIRPGRPQALALCLLIGLATGQHARNATLYRWSWEEQRRLFWQLKWRAPGLEPYTALYGNGALVAYMGSWANISAINLLYSPAAIPRPAYYWYFDVYRYNVEAIVEQRGQVIDEKNFLTFSAPATQSVVMADQPETDQCLWIVSEADRHNPYLEKAILTALPLSDLSRILPGESSPPPQAIFGPEPPHTWCFYFQKARLAEQMGDWEQVMQLWEQAQAKGFRPRSEPELVPFILAAAHTARWETALQLSDRAYYPTYVMHDYLCTTWRRIRDETPPSSARQEALSQAHRELDCGQIFQP